MATTRDKKKQAEQAKRAVSLNPNDMMEGGGLLDNITATVTKARFVMTDYLGKSKTKRPAAHIILEDADGDEFDDQFWSCGRSEDWEPTDDGKGLEPVGSKSSIHKSSNFGMLMQSLVDCGWPEDKFDSDITFIEGMVAHFQQVPTGRDDVEKDGKKFKDTALCVSDIEKFPWESKKGGKSKASTAKGKGSSTKADAADGAIDPDVEEAAAMEIQMVLNELEPGEGVQLKVLGTQIMQNRKQNKDDAKVTNQIVKFIFNNPEWMADDDRPWTVEDGQVFAAE